MSLFARNKKIRDDCCMASQRITITVGENVADKLEEVAQGMHLTRELYGKLALSRLADLKPERALDALAGIPKEYFRRGPGRPSSSPATPQGDDDISTNDRS